MQTVKPRAKYLVGPGGLMWEVSHPDIGTKVWSTLPRDAAAMLLERHVVYHQCAPKRGGGAR